MDGSDANVVPLALARLERMIQSRLSADLGFEDRPGVTVRLYEAKAATERGDVPSIPADPEFYESLVDRILHTIDRYMQGDGAPVELDARLDAPSDFEDDLPSQTNAPPRTCDYFVGRLRCSQCSHVSRSDASTRCETFVRPTPDGAELALGDEVEFDRDAIPCDYYAWVDLPEEGEPLHVVEGWECPECQWVNWAEVVIHHGVIQSVWAVELTREVLSRASLVSSECIEYASRLTGRPAWSLHDKDILEILLDEL